MTTEADVGFMATALPLLAAAAASTSECEPIPGWDAVLAGNAQYIVVGELHGTVESPAIFADAVCNSAMDEKVNVALELPETDQEGLDNFLASDGEAEARAALLAAPIWTNSLQDGRSSAAFLTLIEELRLLFQAGRIGSVVAFQPGRLPETGYTPAWYEERMAELIVNGSEAERRTLVLVGNAHAQLKNITFGERTYSPMAMHLPSERTLTLYVVGNGGAAWTCQGNGVDGPECAAHPVRPPPEQFERGVRLQPMFDGAFDGQLGIGGNYTASPPAIP